MDVKERAAFRNFEIIRYSNDSIRLLDQGREVVPVLPEIRRIAEQIGVKIRNKNGNLKNTRQTGAQVIRALNPSSSQSRTQRSKGQNLKVKVAERAMFRNYEIIEYSSGTIELFEQGREVVPVLPEIRRIANLLGIDTHNGAGNLKNTRQTGHEVIRALNARS